MVREDMESGWSAIRQNGYKKRRKVSTPPVPQRQSKSEHAPGTQKSAGTILRDRQAKEE
jgi:hypothetical protein